jgi:hypothetical protein
MNVVIQNPKPVLSKVEVSQIQNRMIPLNLLARVDKAIG